MKKIVIPEPAGAKFPVEAHIRFLMFDLTFHL